MAQINVQVSDDVKEAAIKILHDMGIPITQVVNMLFRQIIRENGVPLSMHIPNAETIEAIEEIRNGGGETFESAREMIRVDHGYLVDEKWW